MNGDRKISWPRVAYLFSSVLASALSFCFSGDWLKNSADALNYIGLTFSILAATQFAVVAILGDPGMLLSGTRRLARESSKEIQRKLQRLNGIFLVHLCAIFLLVVCSIVRQNSFQSLDWVFSLLAFFSTFGFLMSVTLPFELAAAQKLRLEQELENRAND